jgi:hypothetical protein
VGEQSPSRGRFESAILPVGDQSPLRGSFESAILPDVKLQVSTPGRVKERLTHKTDKYLFYRLVVATGTHLKIEVYLDVTRTAIKAIRF